MALERSYLQLLLDDEADPNNSIGIRPFFSRPTALEAHPANRAGVPKRRLIGAHPLF